jgi:hypothetical protein
LIRHGPDRGATRRRDLPIAGARDPARLAGTPAEVIRGTPYDYETVATAIEGCDAVINVLNVSRTSDNPWASLAAPADLISTACANALRAMERSGTTCYLALGTIGASESWAMLPLVVRLMVGHSNLRVAFADHTRQEELLRGSAVAYAVARAPMLNDQPTDGPVRVARPGEKVHSSISRSAVAALFFDILASGRYQRAIVHISREP